MRIKLNQLLLMFFGSLILEFRSGSNLEFKLPLRTLTAEWEPDGFTRKTGEKERDERGPAASREPRSCTVRRRPSSVTHHPSPVASSSVACPAPPLQATSLVADGIAVYVALCTCTRCYRPVVLFCSILCSILSSSVHLLSRRLSDSQAAGFDNDRCQSQSLQK